MSDGKLSNKIGYKGSTSYTLKYITKTRNFRYTWPHNNVFNRAKHENELLQSILSQPVGETTTETPFDATCEDLKPILKRFLQQHQRTNYKLILRKSQKKDAADEHGNETSVKRYVLKEFLHRIINSVIPEVLFGTPKNRIQFERNLKQIIGLGKVHVFMLNTVMRNVTTKSRPYLRHVKGNYGKTNLLAKLHLWLVRVYIFGALKCVFYVTESNTSGKYLFYDKQVWQRIQQRNFNNMKVAKITKYERNIKRDTLKNIHLLKFLPKQHGFRPIYSKWKNQLSFKLKTIEEVKIIRQLLSMIAEFHLKISQTSVEDFRNRWLNLYFTWVSLGKPTLYFVRTDFVNAFGSIKQEKLMEIIKKLKDEYGDIPEIRYKHQKCLKRVGGSTAFRILEDYVTNFLFKNDKYIYKLTEGICQGGPLSSILCSLYFGEINCTYLLDFINDPLGLIAQNCDDYLYITLSHEKAFEFLNRLKKGFPDFNMQVNYNKTETNLTDDTLTKASFGRFEIDVNTFQLYSSYKFYEGISLFHNSIFRSVSNPGRLVLKRLLFSCTMKLDESFLDCTYNTFRTILYNVFLTANLAAARCFSLINGLLSSYNEDFIFFCVYACSTRIAKVALKKCDQQFADFINENVLKWICAKAFLLRFKKRGSHSFKLIIRIEYLLKNLEKNLSDRQNNEIISLFKHIEQPSIFRSIM